MPREIVTSENKEDFDAKKLGIKKRTAIKEKQTHIDINGEKRHVYNSANQRIHDTEEGVKNFYKWFGKSKVVDEQGRPKVVYHGTNADFDKFDQKKQRPGQYGGKGFFFSEDEKVTKNFGDKVMPAYLKAEIGLIEKRKFRQEGQEKEIDHIRPSEDRNIWLVMHPHQIKSAKHNTGDYSEDHNIHK